MKRRVHVVFECHGSGRDEIVGSGRSAKPLYLWLERLGVKRSDHVIAMCHPLREFLVERYRVDPTKVIVLWGPADCEMIYYRTPRRRPVLVFGYAGNDQPWQGTERILEACREFVGRRNVRFDFIGLDPERYQATVLPNARFLGMVDRSEIPEALGECDVLLSTRNAHKASHLQYPHKLSEYLAAGRPVIGTDVSDQARILREANCGWVIPPGDTQALIAAINEAGQLSFEEREEMGRRARRYAEAQLSADALGAKLQRLYDG